MKWELTKAHKYSHVSVSHFKSCDSIILNGRNKIFDFFFQKIFVIKTGIREFPTKISAVFEYKWEI